MKHIVAIALLTLFLIAFVASAQTIDPAYVKTLYSATALLYAGEEDGSMKMRCSATAIDKDSTGYTFVTAAHCGCVDNEEAKSVSPEKTYFFITSDEAVTKTFLRAQPVGCGYRHRGDDFMLIRVETNADFPVIPLGEDPQLLSALANVASPLGLGKQVFTGTVSSTILDRPVVQDDINWQHAILLQLFGVNGGSSGSSLICLEQKAICGFIVGSVGNTSMVGLPVSRFKKFQAALKAGEYEWWNPDPDVKRKETKKK